MGSLLAGWHSPALDPKTVAFKRNSSLTKEDIDAYWRANKKPAEEEHFGAISNLSDSIQENTFGNSEKRYERSNSAPLANIKEDLTPMKTEKKIIKKSGWWTRSNWAFLNEPPH